MHPTQAAFALAKAASETIGAELFQLDREWTDEESAAYEAAQQAYRKAEHDMIEWAISQCRRFPQFGLIADLNQRAKSIVHRRKLADICFRLQAN